ncbi:hypothetical protein ABWH92_10215 [Ahrensia marina]|uniref:hypothetical protein n=1 Tax=Ahrensia marina TaxID=1514904 RepID=UPI0035CEF51C
MMADEHYPPEPHPDAATPLPSTSFDPDEYREHLAEFDMTKEQEDEFLESLWCITQSFVDLAFGMDPVQLVSREIDAGGSDEAK